MASEDSVEDLIDRTSTLLTVVIHRIGDFNNGRQPCGPTMQSAFEKIHGIFKQLHIGASR